MLRRLQLALLWEEYRAGAAAGFGYSWFCDLYRVLHGWFMLGHLVSMPGNLAAIADLLVSESQRRGRFRRRYKGATLREDLSDED